MENTRENRFKGAINFLNVLRENQNRLGYDIEKIKKLFFHIWVCKIFLSESWWFEKYHHNFLDWEDFDFEKFHRFLDTVDKNINYETFLNKFVSTTKNDIMLSKLNNYNVRWLANSIFSIDKMSRLFNFTKWSVDGTDKVKDYFTQYHNYCRSQLWRISEDELRGFFSEKVIKILKL